MSKFEGQTLEPGTLDWQIGGHKTHVEHLKVKLEDWSLEIVSR